ncbi:PREDICTED: uncharacterized protein LOC105448529 [Wasmannia auropunctata]|uniref:uncharacterized protein LOC105448529 n=1 Tax=Wasmannia auropunctata TaxID=64793 RepID=UPI0005EF8124|nr:PREDICTED: uncharacterized protein LOC105448529 [Wasmannia auropunctata]
MKKEKHVNLLYVEKDGVGHFTWIKNLSRLVSSQLNKNAHKKYICDRCLHYFSLSEKLEVHTIDCGEMNECAIRRNGLDRSRFGTGLVAVAPRRRLIYPRRWASAGAAERGRSPVTRSARVLVGVVALSARGGWSAPCGDEAGAYRHKLEYIPKVVLLREFPNCISQLWDRLPEHIKADSEVQQYHRCLKHYNQPSSRHILTVLHRL